jgi:AraC-like DNA-binding protein
MLGYSSPGNFTYAFKRWHGSSPRQYRQKNR